MAVLKNRAKMSTSTTGTGTISLGSALSGYQSFTAAGLTTGAITRYTIQDGANWEIGLGTYTTSGTTLTRTPSESSSGGSAINLSGNAEVFITATARDVSPLYDANFVTQTTSSYNGPSATGTDAIAIGLDALASGTRSVGIGALATGTNVGAIASGNGAVALGGSNASGTEAFSANNSRNDATFGSTGANSVTLGYQSRAQATYSIAIGYAAIAGGQYGIALGFSRANGDQSFSIGQNASTASGANTIVIGKSISSSVDDEIAIGGTGNTIKLFNAYTLPTSDGSAGTALVTNGSGALSFSSVGADLYAANESSPSAQPSATGTNAIAIGDSSTSSGNQSFALGGGTASDSGAFAFGLMSTASDGYAIAFPRSTASARGSFAAGSNGLNVGSVAAGIGSMALATSYASGTSSFAAVITNNTSSYGATGANSIAMGYQAKATNTYSTSIGSANNVTAYGGFGAGDANTVSGDYGVAIGRQNTSGSTVSSRTNVALGYGNSATGGAAFAIGDRASTQGIYGKMAHSSGYGAGLGTAQSGEIVLYGATTDATPKAICSGAGSSNTADATNQVVLPNNSVYGFTGTVIARENSAQTNDFAVWEIKGGAVRAANAGTTALGSYNINKISESTGAANWSIALSADTTNGAVAITVTGEASHSIRWVATVNTTEVTY